MTRSGLLAGGLLAAVVVVLFAAWKDLPGIVKFGVVVLIGGSAVVMGGRLTSRGS